MIRPVCLSVRRAAAQGLSILTMAERPSTSRKLEKHTESENQGRNEVFGPPHEMNPFSPRLRRSNPRSLSVLVVNIELFS